MPPEGFWRGRSTGKLFERLDDILDLVRVEQIVDDRRDSFFRGSIGAFSERGNGVGWGEDVCLYPCLVFFCFCGYAPGI